MHERALREALEEYAARRLPADPDLWPAIRARAAAYRRPGQPGGAPPAGQGARSGAVTGAARRWRPPRLAAVADVTATLLLLVAVALVLALMLPGMTGRRERGGLGAGPSPTPTPAPPPPGQPFPVPADCPVTPLRGPEERKGYTAYWLDDHGWSLGIATGVLYEGVSDARSTDLRTVEGRLGGGPAVPLQLYGLREESGFGAIAFPEPGCWQIEGQGWRNEPKRFAATVYVYPGQCRGRVVTGPALPAFPKPCVAPDGSTYPTPATARPTRPPGSTLPPPPPAAPPLPYPVPASCAVTPLSDYETRGTYSGYWLEGEGGMAVAFSPERVLLADTSGANVTVWMTPGPPLAITGRLGNGPSVALPQDAHYLGPGLSPGASAHTALLVFPQTGCWRIEASAGSGRLNTTVYVYPFACAPARLPSTDCAPPP